MQTTVPAWGHRREGKSGERPEVSRLFPVTVAACAGISFLISAAGLLGWAVGNQALMTVVEGHASMKPNTAICFIALSLALSRSVAAGSRWTVRGAAGLVLCIAGITLAEFATGLNLHVDESLFHDAVQTTYPGRMAAISAINFCLASVSLLLLTGGRRQRRLAEALAAVLTTVAFTAIIGFCYGVPVLYGGEGRLGYVAMALHTGVAFLLIGTGLLLAAQDSVLGGLLAARERGSWAFRRVLPAMLVVPAILGWAYLRPGVTFGSPVFGIALFAVTMVVAGVGGAALTARVVNREEQQIAELGRVREQSAEAVRQSERELRLITDHLPTLLSYVDAAGRFVRVNRTYEVWLGKPAAAIVGRTLRDLLGEDYWESTAPMREAALRGETVTFEAVYPTVQGKRETQVTYAPDLDDEGRVRGMACLVLDMYDRRKAEAALRQSEKLAVVGRLASSIAHEMNNPLEAVTNLLYLAEQETEGKGQTGEYVALAQQELARVTHIVTQTLRFHRQSTRPIAIRMSELVGQVLALHHGKLAQGLVRVEPRYRDQAALLCRDGEVRQVLANLVGNAADAMNGGGRLLIRTTAGTDWRSGRIGVRVTVADTGHGIGEATRSKLFEPFHTTKGETGSGLGLWISKEIVERHGGRLVVRTSVRPGASGTVFQVFLEDLPRPAENKR